MSDSVKILIFAATVIITCILVSLGFRAADAAKDISNSAFIQMAELNDDIKDSDVKNYDDTFVYGSDVVNCIKKYLGDYSDGKPGPIYIYVKTLKSDNTYTDASKLADIKDFAHDRYIKPTAVFDSDILRNENKIIIGISFIQR